MAKFVIDNCVPLNNGDAALVFSLFNQLKEKDKNNEIKFSTLNLKDVKDLYPEYSWYPSYINSNFYNFIFNKLKLKWLWKFVIACNLYFSKNIYKESDVIISAPGGYIHSYYGIEARMFILWFCKKYLKKKVIIYSQSVGNLNDRDKYLMLKYGQSLDYILLRDQVSYNRCLKYGLKNNIVLTKDAAFMLNSRSEIKTVEMGKKNVKKVAISMREWSEENRNMDRYFNLMNLIVRKLLEKNYEIHFISTCQGIESYRDDSKIAKKFVNEYDLNDNTRISIIDNYYDLEQLQSKIKEYDFVIGTRLHMCILSLINGVFAFNISYEEKGKEAYNYLGLQEYTADFNDSSIIDKITNFLDVNESELRGIFNNVNGVSIEQEEIFDKIYNTIM